MIKYVKGNLLDMFDNGDFDAIIHGCNCQNIMGSGIAGQIRERYPEAYEADTEAYNSVPSLFGVSLLGKVSIARLPSKQEDGLNRVIINAYTQTFPGAGSFSFDALKKIFEDINKASLASKQHVVRIGIPKIGAGIAGEDWNKIIEVIEKATPNSNITVVEYTE